MAYGACDDCGCALQECECGPEPETETGPPVPWPTHGSYLTQYMGVDLVEKLTPYRAFELLRDSTITNPTGEYRPWPGAAAFVKNRGLVNKMWACISINLDLGYMDMVYNHDGRYSLRRMSLQSFRTAVEGHAHKSKPVADLLERFDN